MNMLDVSEIGKVDNGEIAVNKECIVVNAHDPERKEKCPHYKLYEFEGLDKVDVKDAQVGSIVAISGISDLSIGDTICDVDGAEAIPFQKISEPTISMQFMVNDSPLAGSGRLNMLHQRTYQRQIVQRIEYGCQPSCGRK